MYVEGILPIKMCTATLEIP